MKIYLSILICTILLFSGCMQNKTSISLLCEKRLNGNYELKWEIYPEPESTQIEIFASINDSIFFSLPAIIANADDYIAIVSVPDSLNRHFFRLKVGETISKVVTNRFFDMESIQNFRDIGGYRTINNKQVRWGKIFRSGSVKDITALDSTIIARLDIRSLIDIRAKDAAAFSPNQNVFTNYYRLPIGENGYEAITEKIKDDQFLRGDAVIYTQDFYKSVIEDYTAQYAQFFDYLTDESNYPVLYNCLWGKDQTGLATYFLLRALDVPSETIEEDYMASNRGVIRPLAMEDVHNLSESGQEALTMITNTDIVYLRYALSCVRKKSGTVDEYMTKELKLTPEKRRKLKEILLY